MKRVLNINYDFILGGVETSIMNTYRNIDRKNVQFDFVVTGNSPVYFKDEIEKMGGKIFYINKKDRLINSLFFVFKLYKLLKQHSYYAVQSHFSYTGGLDCLIAAMAGVKKRYITSHGSTPLSFWKIPISRFLMNRFATKRLAVSSKAGKALYGNAAFQIINNGIDIKRFAFDKDKRDLNRAKLNVADKFVIGNVARFSKEKNQLFLLEIFKIIHKKNKSAVLLFIGGGETEPTIKNKVKETGLDQSVLFLGSTKDCNALYQVMDCFVFPSKSEGFGIVAIEAECSGLPCFISDGVPNETMICNTTKIPLSKSAKEWADIILDKTKGFQREDCSLKIKNAGFDIKDTAKLIEQEYLQ